MFDLWVWFALGGAFFQNLRSLQQRRLTATLSRSGASYSRFLYALPLAWLYLYWWPVPMAAIANGAFLAYCLLGGVAQIVGTWCLVGAVSDAGFASGTAFSKTEAAQTALIGLLLLADPVDGVLLSAIALSLVGVALLFGAGSREPRASAAPPGARARTAALLGLAAGAGFALAAVCFRGAALAVAPEVPASSDSAALLAAAAWTLAVTLTLQTLLQGLWLARHGPGELQAVLRGWRRGSLVGVSGMLASLCWFSGVALYSAAAVRAVGQVEMVFALLTGVLLFRERLTLKETAGMALIALAVVILAVPEGVRA
ncbi:MAG: EamA family transporter [Pseudomonadota bacterium]